MMGSTVWRYYGKTGIALKYWFYGIGQFPGVLFKRQFTRSVEKTIKYRILVFTGKEKKAS